MVSFKRLLIVGIFLVAAVLALPNPYPDSEDTSIGLATTVTSITGSDVALTKRQQRGRILLQCSETGIVFLIGNLGAVLNKLPPELQEMIQNLGEFSPGRALFANWEYSIRDNGYDIPMGAFGLQLAQ